MLQLYAVRLALALGVLILLLLQRPDVPDTRMGMIWNDDVLLFFVGLFESMEINGNQKLDDLSSPFPICLMGVSVYV